MSFVQTPRACFIAYSRDGVLQGKPDTYAAAADMWVEQSGGAQFDVEEPVRLQALGGSGATRGRETRVLYELPPDALDC